MTKILKYFVYVVACGLLFLLLVANFGRRTEPTPIANAFEWEKEVQVFFVKKSVAELESCLAEAPLNRKVLNAETLGPGALSALIEGLRPEEQVEYFSAVNPATLIQKFEILGGTAYVDFNSALNQGLAGSCNAVAVRSQIENTLMALPDIDRVVISIDGETEGILEP